MLNRLLPPPAHPLTSLVLPVPTVSTLPNGARLHLLAGAAQPVVRLQVVVPAGRATEPSPGLAQLAARLLTEGTATRSARQVADEVAFYGASLEVEAGPDRATLTLYCLSRHLPTLLPLVVEVLAAPAFGAEELAQAKTRISQNIRVERQKTSFLAGEEFNKQLFGAESAYGRPFDEASFNQLSADELRAFHAVAYAPAGADILLSGDVSGAMSEGVKERMSEWGGPMSEGVKERMSEGTKQTVPSYPHSLLRSFTHSLLVPGSLQASIRMGRPWPALTGPDTPELLLLVKVLGGYFGSRLMRNIREDKGFTYGIQASVVPREGATALVIGTDIKGDSVAATLREIALEMRRLQDEPLAEDELETVRNYTLGKLLGETATVFEQADKYRTALVLGLPDNYYSELVRRTQAATAADLQRLAQRYFSSEEMLTVVAGGG